MAAIGTRLVLTWFATLAAAVWLGSAIASLQSDAELDSQHGLLVQYVQTARDAIATCDEEVFQRASAAIEGIRENAVRARKHLIEREVDIGLARQALLEERERRGDSPELREEIQILVAAKRDLDIPIKRWQRLVDDASGQVQALTALYEECAKPKPQPAGEGTRTRTGSPEPKPAPKETGPPPIAPAPGARTVCAPCQEFANQLAQAEQDFYRAQRRFAAAQRAQQEALIEEANLERRLQELLDRFNYQIGKGASSGVDPNTGRPIDSRFIATGQVQITTTNADGTTSTTLRDSNYMNALKEQIKKTEEELQRADNEGLKWTHERNIAKNQLEEATARCDQLENALDDCIKKFCTKPASRQSRLGDPSDSGETTKWSGSAPGTITGPYAKPNDPPVTLDRIGSPGSTLRRMLLDLVKDPDAVLSAPGPPAPPDPLYQLVIIVIRRTAAPGRGAPTPKAPASELRDRQIFGGVGLQAGPAFGFTRPMFSSPGASTDRFASSAERTQGTSGASSVRTYLTSLGGSTGDAFELRVVNDGPEALELEGEGVVVEPIQERAAADARRELQNLRADRGVSSKVDGYCLEFLREPPLRGMMLRIAKREVQERFEPARRIVGAAQQLQDKRAFTPDSDPAAYFHSIRQWAIWTHEQRFDAQSFGNAFVEHTRKNLQASGRQWSKPIEDAVRGFVPGRWRDIQQVLAEAGVSTR